MWLFDDSRVKRRKRQTRSARRRQPLGFETLEQRALLTVPPLSTPEFIAHTGDVGDYRAEAMDLGAITRPVYVKDAISYVNDVDMYRIAVFKDQIITIDVDASISLDSTLKMTSPESKRTVAANSRGRSEEGEELGWDPFIRFVAPKDGVYFIAVSSFRLESPYDPDTSEGRDDQSVPGTPETGVYSLVIRTTNLHADALSVSRSQRDSNFMTVALTFQLQDTNLNPQIPLWIHEPGSYDPLFIGHINTYDTNGGSASMIGSHTVIFEVPASVFADDAPKLLTLDPPSWSKIRGNIIETNELDNSFAVNVSTPAPPSAFFDFGASGLWSWSQSTGYVQLSPYDPQTLAASNDGSLFVDFGPAGVWRWNQAVGFQLINGADAQGIVAGSDGSLFVDFGSYGIWRWTSLGGIVQLISSNPEALVAAPDTSLFIDFGLYGIWRWSSGAGFVQIGTGDPQGIAVPQSGGVYDGSLFLDFGQGGLWRWDPATGYRLLIASNPERLTVAADGSLAIDFGAFGLWRWTKSGGFQQLNTANPESLAFGANGWLYIDFGPAGLWIWVPTGAYVKLHSDNIQGLATI